MRRIERINNHCLDTKIGYSQLNDEDRAGLYVVAGNLFGADLKKAIMESVTQSTVKRSSFEFKGTGEFLDQTDLEEKY